MSKYKKTIKNIIKTINNNPKLKLIFYFKTKNRKYTVKQLLKAVLLILKSGVSYRLYGEISTSHYDKKYIDSVNKPHWNTIYKFFGKLIKYNIILDTFKDTISKYMLNRKNNIYITDTSLIANKGGIDNIAYNPQLLKHKSSKVSIITNNKGSPINVNIYSGNNNDGKILAEQLDSFTMFRKDNNNILLGDPKDAGYDSNNGIKFWTINST